MFHSWLRSPRRVLSSLGMLLLTLLVVACGGAMTAGSSGASNSAAVPASNGASSSGKVATSSQSTSSSNGQNKNTAAYAGPQYLIKTLKVSLEVKDTQKVADEIQSWIATTDPRSSSAGTDYQQSGDSGYTIAMNFSVQATIYPQIYHYLSDYASGHQGHLLSFHEDVQDATNDYVDTQSRIKNLRGEQARLLDLLNHAQALGDILSIEQRLTDVEGQIESMEAHYNSLTAQVTFYTVTVALQPTSQQTPPPPPAAGWSVGQTFHDAFTASLGLAQGLLAFLIWLLAFSIYIIPIALIAWFAIRLRKRSQALATPPVTKD